MWFLVPDKSMQTDRYMSTYLLTKFTTKPPYLHHVITIQPLCSTRFSSLVTLSRPPTSSTLVTDRSFLYASPHLWNKRPPSLRQPHSTSESSLSLPTSVISTASVSHPLSSSITPPLFHSQLKTYLFFHKSFPLWTFFLFP